MEPATAVSLFSMVVFYIGLVMGGWLSHYSAKWSMSEIAIKTLIPILLGWGVVMYFTGG